MEKNGKSVSKVQISTQMSTNGCIYSKYSYETILTETINLVIQLELACI